MIASKHIEKGYEKLEKPHLQIEEQPILIMKIPAMHENKSLKNKVKTMIGIVWR